jgi:hypothetical protein
LGASATRTTTAEIMITEVTATRATAADQDESQLALLKPPGERGDRWNWVLATEATHPDDHGVTVDEVGLGGHRAAVDRQRDSGTRRVGLSVSQDLVLLSGEISPRSAPKLCRHTPSPIDPPATESRAGRRPSLRHRATIGRYRGGGRPHRWSG